MSDEESLGRTDDPVRMYLREMGSVELLSREGEIAIAKRIEAGRDMMIGGLCESPFTFRAIIGWHERLKAGNLLLRDIIDLEATQAGGAPSGEEVGEGAPDGAADNFEAPTREEIEDAEDAEGGGLSLLGARGEAQARDPRAVRGDRGPLQEASQDPVQAPRDADRRRGDRRQVRALLREAARGAGRQGRAGPPAQQPHRGAGPGAQAPETRS